MVRLMAKVTISLTASGSLQFEFPGFEGSTRLVPFREGEDTILRVLRGLARDEEALGQTGSPTQQQVRHWERHSIFADPRCPWCKAAKSQKEMVKDYFSNGGTITKKGKIKLEELDLTLEDEE